MKTKLIQALREAARRVVDPEYEYRWIVAERCNCGTLAACIIGRPIQLFDDLVDPSNGNFNGCWGSSAYRLHACAQTGLPMPYVFSALRDVGLGANEIRETENCENRAVLLRMGLHSCPYDKDMNSMRQNATFVARYFTAWADLLEEESQPVIPTTTQDQIHTIEARDVLMVPSEMEAVS